MGDFGFQWHITDRCNLRCAHCYQDQYASRPGEGLERLQELAGRVFGAPGNARISVNITGGEPLLVPHLFELLEHLRLYPNLEEINLITNGTVATAEVLRGIREAGKLRLLKVSLESGKADINDRIRGAGNLERVSGNLELYRREGGKPVVLMTTLGVYNLDTIEDTVGFARGAGAAGIIFERFVPLGAGRVLRGQALSAPEWLRAVQAVVRAGGLEADALDLFSYRAFWLHLDSGRVSRIEGARCNLGEESMALMPDGTVFPCRRLPLPVGNALIEPFAQIRARLEQFNLARLRPRLAGERCGFCGVDHCMGCRALSYAQGGDLLADDPQCYL